MQLHAVVGQGVRCDDWRTEQTRKPTPSAAVTVHADIQNEIEVSVQIASESVIADGDLEAPTPSASIGSIEEGQPEREPLIGTETNIGEYVAAVYENQWLYVLHRFTKAFSDREVDVITYFMKTNIHKLRANHGSGGPGMVARVREIWSELLTGTKNAKSEVSRKRNHAAATGGGPPLPELSQTSQAVASLFATSASFHGIVDDADTVIETKSATPVTPPSPSFLGLPMIDIITAMDIPDPFGVAEIVDDTTSVPSASSEMSSDRIRKREIIMHWRGSGSQNMKNITKKEFSSSDIERIIDIFKSGADGGAVNTVLGPVKEAIMDVVGRGSSNIVEIGEHTFDSGFLQLDAFGDSPGASQRTQTASVVHLTTAALNIICAPCLLFDNKKANALASLPFHDWKNLSTVVKRDLGDSHNASVAMSENFVDVMEGTKDSINDGDVKAGEHVRSILRFEFILTLVNCDHELSSLVGLTAILQEVDMDLIETVREAGVVTSIRRAERQDDAVGV
ncbi:hypothetical protein DPMN_090950 [Dreissena polymorpha]|uniref:Uncharacterized protein n=1 Tax=Dreissena polymorpha TaxID=45954 RepID=A0A9D4KYN8_DREPO|nr:hypothetical protein DPMN_090950 [Dreissena polymorpha]